jgi:SAM-dependent methyltransferase
LAIHSPDGIGSAHGEASDSRTGRLPADDFAAIRRNLGGFASASDRPLRLEPQRCCLCGDVASNVVGAGYDFEYASSPNVFGVHRCQTCSLVFLSTRTALFEFDTIYPDSYHAYQFNEAEFGFVYRVRRRLEARRLLSAAGNLESGARILDVGCGDGFHLSLLRDFGRAGWELEGVDASHRAVSAALKRGFVIHQGLFEELEFRPNHYDLVLLIATIEHVANPVELMRAIQRVLKPGGRLLLVTDSTDTLDFWLFKKNVWGGYHFPRHWYLFDRRSLARLALSSGFGEPAISTAVSPVNWVYSIRNRLVDLKAPSWLIQQFSLRTALPLAVFTVVDLAFQLFGRGALLRMVATKPAR